MYFEPLVRVMRVVPDLIPYLAKTAELVFNLRPTQSLIKGWIFGSRVIYSLQPSITV